jgi:plasmid stabilization system protein ParE
MQSISDYLQEHHPQYHQPTMRKLYAGICALKDAAYRGRPGLIEGTRELLFPPMPYVAVYSLRGGCIEIWRVYHTSQNRG